MELDALIEKVGDLPTLPTVVARINREMENESLTAHGLGVIISEDSAFTSRILRLSNSAFYGMPKQISSVDKAVTILGFDTVKNLALSLSVYSFFKGGRETVIDIPGLWNHSLACAVCTKLLIAKSSRKLAEEAFLFGILHDIGKMLLINNNLADMENVLRISRDRGITQNEAEREIFGFTHQKAGARLAKKWKFPGNIVMGIKLHHDLPPEIKKLAPETAALVRALCVGNQMAKALSLGISTNPHRRDIPVIMWKSLHVNRNELPKLSVKMKEDFNMILRDWGND
ncbi:MAG: HDOD domain-containing protein [Deltaproteobacteria bacterium]|nr:HDOD domain-containing protein [Deltaproteobacteria bacterium]